MKDKLVSSVKERVTSLEKELNETVSFDVLAKALKKGFEGALGIELVEGRLSAREKALAKKFEEEFESTEWNSGRVF
jgi:lipoate-protein ligase A